MVFNVEKLIQTLLNDTSDVVILCGVILGVTLWQINCNWELIKRPYNGLVKWHEHRKQKEELLQMVIDDHKYCQTMSCEKEEWTKRIDSLFEKMSELQKETNERFEILEEKNNKRVRAELKDKIGASYRYFHEKKQINDMEIEALEDLIEAYEDAKGENSFVHSVVQKEMYTWKKIERS